MPDSLEQLQAAAKDIRERGMAPDRIVLRAIGLGCDTRKAIKEATGFDYASIEKALEREAGSYQVVSGGPIDRFVLAGSNQNGNHYEVFDSQKETELKCESCGAPRSPGSGRLCRKCYQSPVKTFTPEQRIKAGELRAQGKSMHVIAAAFNISPATFDKRRKDDPLLEEALDRGREAYMQSGEDKDSVTDNCEDCGVELDRSKRVNMNRCPSCWTEYLRKMREQKKETSPVAYIEESKEPMTKPSPVRLIARNESPAPVLTRQEIRNRIAAILCIADVNSPVLTDALVEAEKAITAHVLNAQNSPPVDSAADLLARFNKLPSALLKEIRDDDAWFTNAYETLIGILDDRMDGEEKAAVWTLILYLKSIEKERYAQENH